VARRSSTRAGKIQPMALFLTGIGFIGLGLRNYPAFVAVGGLFLIIGYRGFTCTPVETLEKVSSNTENDYRNR
jgi:hypothetical protein